eukprot:SAG25_NODE_367_length_9118_cov_54.828578_4_plen_91_part_00
MFLRTGPRKYVMEQVLADVGEHRPLDLAQHATTVHNLHAIIDHYATFKVPQASGDRSCPHYKPRNSSEPSVNITRANLTSGGKWVGPWCD